MLLHQLVKLRAFGLVALVVGLARTRGGGPNKRDHAGVRSWVQLAST